MKRDIKIDGGNLYEVLASRCNLKSVEILRRKRVINEYSIWRLRCIRTYDALIVINRY